MRVIGGGHRKNTGTREGVSAIGYMTRAEPPGLYKSSDTNAPFAIGVELSNDPQDPQFG